MTARRREWCRAVRVRGAVWCVHCGSGKGFRVLGVYSWALLRRAKNSQDERERPGQEAAANRRKKVEEWARYS